MKGFLLVAFLLLLPLFLTHIYIFGSIFLTVILDPLIPFTRSDLLSSSSDSDLCPVDTPFYNLDDDTGSVLKSSVDFFWMLPLLWF